MKFTPKVLLVMLMLMASTAFATDRNPPPTASNSNAHANAAAAAFSGSYAGGGAGGAGGYAGVSVNEDYDTEKPAASSAISPNVSTNNDCQIATPSSKAVSFLFIGISGTTGVVYNDLCYAYKREQYDVADRMMCLKSADYAKANPACSK